MSQYTQADTINYIAKQTYMYGHICIIITGLLGNTIGIGIFATKLKGCVGSFYLLAFYATNNVSILIYILPTLILTIYGTNGTEFFLPWCVAMYYLVHVVMVLSPMILCLASIDRYFCSSRQARIRNWSSITIARISVISAIIAALCFGSPNLIYRHINSDYNDCTAGDPYWYYVSYFLIPVIITGVPLIILSVFGYKTYQNLRSSVHLIQPVTSQMPSVQPATSQMLSVQPATSQMPSIQPVTSQMPSVQSTVANVSKQRNRLDNQVARMLLIQIICFFLQTVLFTIVYFYVTFTYDWEKPAMSAAIENIVSTFIYLIYDTSVSISFYLYLFLSKPFRTTVKSFLMRD